MQKKFREKSQVFLWGKNDSRKKKAIVLETLFGVAFFWKTIWRKNKEKQKIKATIRFPSHAQIFRRDARAIFLLRKFGETKNLYGNLKEWIQLEREVARYICLKILGLRLELEKAVKCLYNTNIWNLLWAPFIRSKICLCFSDVFIAILANSNSQNIAMKQGPLHGVSTPHNTLKQSLRYHIACLFSRFSHYPFLELAVEILRFTEYSW